MHQSQPKFCSNCSKCNVSNFSRHVANSMPMENGALWIASFRDGTTSGREHRCLSVPQHPFLLQALADCGGPELRTKILHRAGRTTLGAEDVFNMRVCRRKGSVIVTSLAKVCGQQHYTDQMTRWTKECRLQREMHGGPSDSYSVSIADMRQVSAPQRIILRRSVGNLEAALRWHKPLFR